MQIALPLAAIGRLLGVPMPALRDRVVRLDDVIGHDARSLAQRLLDAPDRESRFTVLDDWLTRRFASAPVAAPAAVHAVHLLRARPDLDISEIARTIGWSRRHLSRAVERQLGVGPRSYRRLLRFQNATRLAQAATAGWAGIAAEAGYADQAHLTREFREFAGLTPTAYAARLLEEGGGLIEA